VQCPRCGHEGLIDGTTCASCGFSGDLDLLEELSHVKYLLQELKRWRELAPLVKSRLTAHYRGRLEELEELLDVRLPPLSPEEARQMAWELAWLEALIEKMSRWAQRGWIKPEPAGSLIEQSSHRAEELRQRLAASPEVAVPQFDQPEDGLKVLNSVAEAVAGLHTQGSLVDENAHTAIVAELATQRRELEWEIDPSLRPVEEPVAPSPAEAEPGRVEARAEAPARRPREPLTLERVWRTLLSERTLNVMLFLGVFLLFASAVTLVVFNWERFAPLVQVIFIAAFTLTFYGAGWFVRARMGLRSSGIALTAIGSLLVPIDFYAIYLSGGFPREAWPQVWLGVSLLCWAAYLFTALRIQARFFGYLVGVAVGSTLWALMRVAGIHTDWWSPAQCLVSLVATSSVGPLAARDRRWAILRWPLWHVAVLVATVLLPLTATWYATGRAEGESFRLALAITWWLGSTIYGIAAARLRSRALGLAAMATVPAALYLSQLWAFDQLGIRPAWHGLGWALLAPCYLVLARSLLNRGDDELYQALGRAARGWAVGLMALAAVWSATEMGAASVTHTVVAGTVVFLARLVRRPVLLLVASFLFLSAITTGMASRDLALAQLALGWVLLAILHIAAAVALREAPSYAAPVYVAGFALAGLSLIPPLVGMDQGLLVYSLGNWIALAAWSAWLARNDEHPGLRSVLHRAGPLGRGVLHWATAIPLPLFVWLVWTLNDRPPDARLGLVMMGLAWLCVTLGKWRIPTSSREGAEGGFLSATLSERFPWYVVGYTCSLISLIVTYGHGDQALLAVALWAATALYFLSAWAFRLRWWLVPGGVVLPLGLICTLDLAGLALEPVGTAVAAVPAAYILVGLGLQRAGKVEEAFLEPLSWVAHGLAVVAVLWGFSPLWNRLVWGVPWTDVARLWAVAGQLILCITYLVLAWFDGREHWGHVAAWLGVMAGGLLATVYSRGRGSSAAKAALLAAIYVLAERGLHGARHRWSWADRAWLLYRRPLLVAGWTVSAGTILLALGRNLVLLGGGRGRELWAIVALVMVTALYGLSARLFRRPLFVWLAAVVVLTPWTLLTHLNWFLRPYPPALPRYALAWAVLAWVQMGLGLLLDAKAGFRWGQPLRVVSHAVLPFALLWGVADVDTSSLTYGLGAAFYMLAAVVDHRRAEGSLVRTRFLYPAAVLVPVWAVYLMARLVPFARHEHFGLMLLALAPIGLAISRLLRRVQTADELPVSLVGYGCALVGTMLVAHDRPLLAAALLFDAELCVISAWVFRQPLWVYPATALVPASLLLCLSELGVDPHRWGWALIALAALYLGLSWALRRLRLRDYATPVLAAAYVLVALGLPPSSRDQIGAFWGYGAAAMVYAVSAFWLRQPLLLFLSAALCTVPWGVVIVRSPLPTIDYGLAVWPGIFVSLLIAHWLDSRFGAHRGFPWGEPMLWGKATTQRLLNWWALPWYVLGYGATLVSVLLSLYDAPRLTLTLALSAVAYALAARRFRLRGWLLASAIAAQAAALAGLDGMGYLDYAARGAMLFLPVTGATALLGLFIERKQAEGSPFGGWQRAISGWSRPLYALVLVDVLVAQSVALFDSGPGVLVSVAHALLIALLATVWAQSALSYASAGLGLLALLQYFTRAGATPTDFPVALAALSFGYGLVGYGLDYGRRRESLSSTPAVRVWEQPLQRWGLLLSVMALGLATMFGVDVITLAVRALLGLPLLEAADVVALQMLVGVLAITGLLYLAAALVRRWAWLGYAAVILLLWGWGLEWFFIWGMREPQWYAVPAGVYLLGVGYLEWRQDRKTLARWIDRAGLVLLFLSSFWQSMTEANGWPYALLMGAEALLIVWWGSARRQRRFLYFGVAAVVVDVAGQSIEPLLSANRWIVFGVAGLSLVAVAVFVERRLEALTRLSRELRERLEEWE
jgi:hypothetical protein